MDALVRCGSSWMLDRTPSGWHLGNSGRGEVVCDALLTLLLRLLLLLHRVDTMALRCIVWRWRRDAVVDRQTDEAGTTHRFKNRDITCWHTNKPLGQFAAACMQNAVDAAGGKKKPIFVAAVLCRC